MITKQTEKNEKLYGNLYEEASNALRKVQSSTDEDFQNITTLNEYFVHLPELIGLMKTHPKLFKSKFVILPVDEEFFEINANTREIIVPPSFRKSVGVAGDQVAEVIYFIIDRYFDTMDLYNQNIHIEWTTPDGVDGVSEELIRDIESQPGKIIFGWALHDVITKMPGTVEFAVRFWTTKKNKANEDIVEYTLRTLPQKITISKGLDIANLNENERPDALSKVAQEFIFNRIVKSVQDNVGGFVADPELVTLYYTYIDKENKTQIKDVFATEDVNESGQFNLTESINGKYVVYVGIKKQVNGYTTYNVDGIYDKSLNYVLTKDTKYNDNKKYYCYKGNDDYYPIEFDENGIDINNKDKGFEDYYLEGNVYEKLAVFEFTYAEDEIEQEPINPTFKGTTPENDPFELQVKHRIGNTTNENCIIEIYKPGPVDPTENWANNDYYKQIIVEEEYVAIGMEDTDEIYTGDFAATITTYKWEGEDLPENYSEPTYTIELKDMSDDVYNYSVTPVNELNKVSRNGTKNKKFRITKPPVSFDENDIITMTDLGDSIKIEVTTDKFSEGFKYTGLFSTNLKISEAKDLEPKDELFGWGVYHSEEEKYIATVPVVDTGIYSFIIQNYVNGKEAAAAEDVYPKVVEKGVMTEDQVLLMYMPNTNI